VDRFEKKGQDVQTNRTFDLDVMSSGEKGLILTCLLIGRSIVNGGIILVDEPELHLKVDFHLGARQRVSRIDCTRLSVGREIPPGHDLRSADRGTLKRLTAMGLQRKGLPSPADRTLTHPAPPGQRARAPVRGIARRGFQCQRQHPFHLSVAYPPRSSGARLIPLPQWMSSLPHWKFSAIEPMIASDWATGIACPSST
jgi:hypothetical protein